MLICRIREPCKRGDFSRDARLFDPFGLTKLGDSDKMIKENKASECRPRLSYDTLTRRLENNYEINLAHTGRPAL